MDIEGFARRMLEKVGEDEVISLLSERIAEIKGGKVEDWISWARAVVEEVKNAKKAMSYTLSYPESGVRAGESGLGSRGKGDFYIHSLIARIIESTGVSGVVSARDLDDAGVVELPEGSRYVYVAVDGIHSRLSEFPFVAGFHVTRAAMRDVLVMNAIPIAVFSDVHLADDGDVGKVFDHIAGICAVCELTSTPLVAGSTLRIGGDMVIGERLSGGVGCVGAGNRVAARRNAREGDVILMTEGAGGGTVTTAAIYHGYPEVVEETLNVDFVKACLPIVKRDLDIHAMTDVTNGGVRGDAEEIARVSGKKLVFDYEVLRNAVNSRVMRMFEEVGIDFLGVSIDSLMVICDEDVVKEVTEIVRKSGVKIYEVGRVETGEPGAFLEVNGKIRKMTPLFRESAYTPIKKVVGEKTPENFEEIKEKLRRAAEEAIKKKEWLVNRLSRI